MDVKENDRCLVPECEGKACFRGLCLKCRKEARKMTAAGYVADDDLVAMGLLLPKKKGKREESAFEKAFIAKKVAGNGVATTDAIP